MTFRDCILYTLAVLNGTSRKKAQKWLHESDAKSVNGLVASLYRVRKGHENEVIELFRSIFKENPRADGFNQIYSRHADPLSLTLN
jgi:hypothetical protein